MKHLLVLLLLTLTLSVYAADVSVVAHVLDATDVMAHISVKVSNNSVPTTMNVTATVQYQRWGLDEQVSSTPVVIAIQHPVAIKSISLSFPSDWICLTPFQTTVLNDGQELSVTLEYVKVTVRL